MRGDSLILVKDRDEFDRHVTLGHVRGHAHENAFRRDGLIARWHIELTCTEGLESLFEHGEEFVRVEELFYFFEGEDEHKNTFRPERSHRRRRRTHYK